MDNVLVSDFDGTMTARDFFKLAIEHLLPRPASGCPVTNFWREYRAGRITHFEALQRYFAEIRRSEAEVLAFVDRMELDPGLPRGRGRSPRGRVASDRHFGRLRVVHPPLVGPSGRGA